MSCKKIKEEPIFVLGRHPANAPSLVIDRSGKASRMSGRLPRFAKYLPPKGGKLNDQIKTRLRPD